MVNLAFLNFLQSFSLTFYEQYLQQFPFTKKWQTETVSSEKLCMCKTLLYRKAACKILKKLTTLVIFNNILQTDILSPKNSKQKLFFGHAHVCLCRVASSCLFLPCAFKELILLNAKIFKNV